MPKGNWTSYRGALLGAVAMPHSLRPVVALSVIVLLAACGQQTQPTTHGQVSRGGHHSRPASYDPPGPAGDPWGPWIREAARRFDVPERWIREVMRQESGGRSTATSPVGAMGLMQVMPGTYRELQSRYGLGDDAYHPYDSIMAGTAYLREMYDLYGSPAFLAAYNAGPRRLEDYLWNSRGLPDETRNYVARIGPNIVEHHPTRRAAPEVYAAAEIPTAIPRGPRRMATSTMLALREQREAVQPGIQVAQLPPGPVVRMDPIPDGSTLPPVQLASADPAYALGGTMRMDPIPDGATPQGAARIAEAAGRDSWVADPAPAPAVAPLAPPVRRGLTPPIPTPRIAAAPARPVAAPRPVQLASAAPVPLRMSPAAGGLGSGRSLGLLGTANAASLPANLRPVVATTPASGSWAVQVGAFASEGQARSAASQAAGGSGGRPSVQAVEQGRNRLYRARVTGLSQPAAQTACDRLRSRGACMVISPDGQG